MVKKGDWAVDVTTELKQDLEDSARAAYDNGSNLRQDALTLHEARRYPRVAALAILAEEEFSKAFILKICAEQGRWDSVIFSALRKHGLKQGISEAIIEWVNSIVDNYKRVIKSNKLSFIQSQPSMNLSDKKMAEILSNAKSHFKKPIKDFLKQDSLYVNIDDNAKTTSIPDNVEESDAKACLDKSLAMKFIAGVLFGEYSDAEFFEKI